MPDFPGKAFTYGDCPVLGADLCQGDVIQPIDDVRAVMKDVHPHFTDDKYVAFLVLTQTCDLERREGKPCKSRYINLAVVRPLRDVLPSLLERVCSSVVLGGQSLQGYYREDSRSKADQLLQRIFNQNAQAEGLFYLHPSQASRIAEPSVALLQVSVALRAHEHYTLLANARSGRLAEQFQSKLGWLIGNLFSRVATPDWPEDARNALVKAFLEPSDYVGEAYPRWISKAHVRTAEKAGVDLAGKSTDDIDRFLLDLRPIRQKEVAVDRAVSLVKETMAGVSEREIETFRRRLASDAAFAAACKQG
jgi:hypothetical protein